MLIFFTIFFQTYLFKKILPYAFINTFCIQNNIVFQVQQSKNIPTLFQPSKKALNNPSLLPCDKTKVCN